MTERPSSLASELKKKHAWVDIGLLVILWIMVFIVPEGFNFIIDIPIGFLVKIVTLVASLEFISFISFYLIGHKNSLLLQGFIGGFISSTTVFIQLNYDKKFEKVNESILAEALLLATCSMLIECVLIIVSISKFFTIQTTYPFVFMLFFVICFILRLRYKDSNESRSSKAKIEIEINDPITWKKVIYFSLYITFLKYLLVFIQQKTDVPVILGTFLASLFEAHAILAVTITDFTSQMATQEMYTTVLVILSGSLVSKLFFVLRGSVIEKKRLIVLPLLLSLTLTIAASFGLLLF